MNFLRYWPVLEAITEPHIVLQILSSKVFNLLSVTFVVVPTSQLYVSVDLIIDVYNLTFVRFEKSFDIKNFNNV